MKDIYITIHTKEKGKEAFTRREWNKYDCYGTLHRLDGPAVEYSDGESNWYIDGKRHREDGPAVEYYYGSKEWWINGRRHKEDGPAVVMSNGYEEWFLDGRRYEPEVYDKIIEEVEKMSSALGLTDPRQWVRERFKKKLKEVV